MSGLAIYFPRSRASKRTSSSQFPGESLSKKRRLTRDPPPHVRGSPTKLNWHTSHSHQIQLDCVSHLPSLQQLVMPPDSFEVPPSPSPLSDGGWAAIVDFSVQGSENINSNSTTFSDSSFELVPAPSSPIPEVQRNGTTSSRTTASSASSMLSVVRTPTKDSCLPSCFCRLEMDTFGRVPDIERVQLSRQAQAQYTEQQHEEVGFTVSRMLVPRSSWSLFRTSSSSSLSSEENLQPKRKFVAYRGHNRIGNTVTVENEDLWLDEKNPFLLTRFDLHQDMLGHEQHVPGTIIPMISSLNLLSYSTSMGNQTGSALF